MEAKKKTVFKGFDYMHCDDFARFLNDMAAKGWHFKEWGVGLKFEKGEPEQAVYKVEVFTKASEDDMRPEPQTKEFAEYCEVAGWKLIDAKQKFCVFKKIDENAVEMFTPEERVSNSFKAMTSGYAIALLVLYGFNAILQWMQFSTSFEMKIFSGTFLFIVCIWSVMFVGQLLTFIYAFWKKYQLSKKIKKGMDIHIGNLHDNGLHVQLKDIYALLTVLLLVYYFYVTKRMDLVFINIFLLGGMIALSIIINKVRPESNTNVIIQVVCSIAMFIFLFIFIAVMLTDDNENNAFKKDDLPLVNTDYRECADEIEDIDIYHESNFLGSMERYFVFMKEESYQYALYTSKNTKILDRIWEEELGIKYYNENVVDCTTDWGAQLALRNERGMYYVRYENRIFILSEDEDIYLTPEQINIIRDKMGLR